MAAIGFGFDIYELLMGQYIGPGALRELLPTATPGSPEFNRWRGLLLFVPLFTGGLFGLVGGYLTDRLGRRRILSASILLYALSAFFAGFSTSLPMLLFFRCLTSIGVCVEFVAAVAWLAELFPNPAQRERVLGYTQAFSSVGGLSVSLVYYFIGRWAGELPVITLPSFLTDVLGGIPNGQAPWRYLLMSGVIPAVPLILIRPFLPESPIWQQKKRAGTLKRPSLRELFAPGLRRTTIVSTLMFACSYGAAFGAIQQVPYMVEAMPTFQEEARQLSAKDRRPLAGQMAAEFGTAQEIGGLMGRFLLAYLAVRIISRRRLIRVFQVPGLILGPLVFALALVENRVLFRLPLGDAYEPIAITLFHVGIFLVGLLTVAQFSFWGNYLPTVYPVHLRGTGESVAANIGGRMVGTSFALVTSELSGLSFIPGDSDPVRLAYTAAGVIGFVFLAGLLLSFFLPEPSPENLPD
jgi:MFS family permease